MYPWDQSRLQLGPINREVPTLTPRINAMKSKGEWLGGRQDIIILHDIIRVRLVVVIN